MKIARTDAANYKPYLQRSVVRSLLAVARRRSRRARVSSSSLSPRPPGARSRCSAARGRARNVCEEQLRDLLARRAAAPSSPRRRADALALAVLGGEPLEQRVRVRREADGRAALRSASSPTPSKTTTPRAPAYGDEARERVDQLAPVGEGAGVQEVVAVEEVERRLSHRALPPCLVEQDSAAATLTFSDSTCPSSGIETSASQLRRTSGRRPLPSAPKTSATPPARSASHIVVPPLAGGAVDPEVAGPSPPRGSARGS